MKFLKFIWVIAVYLLAIYGGYRLFYDNLDTFSIKKVEKQQVQIMPGIPSLVDEVAKPSDFYQQNQ